MTIPTLSTGKAPLGDSFRWRRTVRRIVGEHRAHTQDQLARCLNLTVNDVVPNPSGGLTIFVPGHRLHLADVCAVAQHATVTVSRGPCRLVAGGRYGRFWWLSIAESSAAGSPRQATALGSRLSIVGNESGGADSHPEPGPDPFICAPVSQEAGANLPGLKAHTDGPLTLLGTRSK
jgi:hypothetical protein